MGIIGFWAFFSSDSPTERKRGRERDEMMGKIGGGSKYGKEQGVS